MEKGQKKRSITTHFQRTKALYERFGCIVERAEYRIPLAKPITLPSGHLLTSVRKDSWGFADLCAVDWENGVTIWCNCCPLNSLAKHMATILSLKPFEGVGLNRPQLLLLAQHRIEIMGWRKLKVPTKKGAVKEKWTPVLLRAQLQADHRIVFKRFESPDEVYSRQAPLPSSMLPGL